MAKKITELTELTAVAADDLLVIEDVSTSTTKKVQFSNLLSLPDASYTTIGTAPTTITALGNRSYTMVFPSVDITGIVSNGMRLKMARTVTAPIQCTDLENGSSQYYSKTSPAGMTFTDDFVVSAWIKLESYPATRTTIASRWNGTSGWWFALGATGQVTLTGYNANAANFSQVVSYQSIPIGKWVHIAAQLDMSTFTATPTTSYVMIDGIDVPASVARGGTNPTALVQAGNLEIGGENGGAFTFDGKLAQVAIYSAKVTQATVRASISQTLSGSETSLISAYSFNNTINDLNANANNLTANGSAVATNADTPFTNSVTGTSITAGTTNYGIITNATFSTNTTITIQVPEGGTIPTSGGVTSVAYSTHQVPYGFPAQKGKWRVQTTMLARNAKVTPVTGTTYNYGDALTIPVGEWAAGYDVSPYLATTTAQQSSSTVDLNPTAVSGAFPTSTGATVVLTSDFVMVSGYISAAVEMGTQAKTEASLSLSTATIYYLNHKVQFTGTGSSSSYLNDLGAGLIYADLTYL